VSNIKYPHTSHSTAAGDIAQKLKDDLSQAVRDAERTVRDDTDRVKMLMRELEAAKEKLQESKVILEYAKTMRTHADNDPCGAGY
jgi:uncharacterized protein YeeX (DUF496 family)